MRLSLIGPLVVIATATACGDVVSPPVQPGLSNQLLLFALLTPDSAHQVVEVGSADGAHPTPTGLSVRLYKQVHGAGTPSWALVANAQAGSFSYYLGSVCSFTPQSYCLEFPVDVEPGTTYKVEASAAGHVAASGTTRVVGNFQIERAALSGNNLLSASWTESLAAHRYMLGVMRHETTCLGCSKAWYTELAGTNSDVTIPQAAVDSAGPVPTLVVSAMDRHYHAFLTTGHGGELFKVPPVQNVEDGIGFVGSVQHAIRSITMNR